MKQKSFTLIELLVVTAIIGLLSSIVLVSFNLPEKRKQAIIGKSLEFSNTIQNVLGAEGVGTWSFDDCGSDGSVPTTLVDTSSYGNHGTNNGATCRADTPYHVVGQGGGRYALSFDGNDYVDVGDTTSLRITGDMTWEVWFKWNGRGTDNYIIEKNYAHEGELSINYGGSKIIRFDHGDGTWEIAELTAANVFSTNVWTHLVMVRNMTEMKIYIYVDGKIAAGSPDTFAKTPTPGSSKLTISGREGGSGFFNGLIDEVRIYNQALTVFEIQKHYVEGLERHQNLAIK